MAKYCILGLGGRVIVSCPKCESEGLKQITAHGLQCVKCEHKFEVKATVTVLTDGYRPQ